jgi:hypothetical protein
VQIFYLRRWTRLALGGGGGAGVFVTPRESGVPTFTDTVSGGAVHLRGALRWYATAHLFFSAELALFESWSAEGRKWAGKRWMLLRSSRRVRPTTRPTNAS